MKIEILILLLIFSPEKIKENHPFWKKLYKEGIKLEQENVKIKKLKNKFDYLKQNWRSYKNLIVDFYSYLKSNFPNPIPFSLFFCYETEVTEKEYDEYQEGEFDISEKNKYHKDKETEYLQFDEAIHHVENDNNIDIKDDQYYLNKIFKENEYNEYNEDYEDYEDKICDLTVINLADKWIKDILSGESFYERNKVYFTRIEVKYFLTCSWFELDNKSVSLPNIINFLDNYWKVKIRANNLDLKFCIPQKYFTDIFHFDKERTIIIKYFKLICTYKRFIRSLMEIDDIWDYITYGAFDGNFDNKTWQDLRHFSNEWHDRLHGNIYTPELETNWEKKTKIIDFEHTSDNITWTIKEITSSILLYEEGKEMYNCVFAYLKSCVSGSCAIFSVKANEERAATLEISMKNSEYRIVQAREKKNAPIRNEELKNIILLWSKKNNINTDIILFDNVQRINFYLYYPHEHDGYYIEEDNAYEEDNTCEEDNEYMEKLNDNIAIANNDDSLDNLEKEFYARLYGIYIKDEKYLGGVKWL